MVHGDMIHGDMIHEDMIHGDMIHEDMIHGDMFHVCGLPAAFETIFWKASFDNNDTWGYIIILCAG